MIVLGIETSCDETAAAIVKDKITVLSNVIASQVDIHKRYGGVVPELACRAHQEAILPIIEEALAEADVSWEQVDAIGVTHGPGLIGALMIGLSTAKALSMAKQIPLIGVHHIEGHIYANILHEQGAWEGPCVALIVSGGHTMLIDVPQFGEYRIMGQTKDDAVGEAYDKVAKMMGLGYPGGPVIDKLAQEGDGSQITLPRPYLKESAHQFSFSGLKTAVKYHLQDHPQTNPAHMAAAFQDAVVDVLEYKAFKALEETGYRQLAVGGGVALNSGLRKRLILRGEQDGVRVSFPGFKLCADNAAMIAGVASVKLEAGKIDSLNLAAVPSLPVQSWLKSR